MEPTGSILESFFHGMQYYLDVSREARQALASAVAESFSVFDYLQPDENLLSRIISDLRTSDSFEKNRHSICLGIEPSQGGMSLSRTCTGLPFFCKPMAQIPWAIACKRRRFDRDNPALLTQ